MHSTYTYIEDFPFDNFKSTHYKRLLLLIYWLLLKMVSYKMTDGFERPVVTSTKAFALKRLCVYKNRSKIGKRHEAYFRESNVFILMN